MIHQKFLALAGAAVIAISSSAAVDAQTLTYTFNLGSTYDFGGGNIYSAVGSFDYDVATMAISNVSYSAVQIGTGPSGPFDFTAGTAVSSTQVSFFGDCCGDENTYFFASSLASGGTISLVGGSYFGTPVTASGSVTADGAVPEPASWALMLGGFGLVGGAMRSRRKVAVSFG